LLFCGPSEGLQKDTDSHGIDISHSEKQSSNFSDRGKVAEVFLNRSLAKKPQEQLENNVTTFARSRT